ncbi:hypothetical protein GGR42_000391 [Saonia flava]|uniref:Uncharacterized protein n=1 Tax=Saonia flava TaxID=523696 RepID=A0A846QZA4_9FLAO|nr:hypothetical protein [Saonia flava]NJB69929.1 hypothetical protein [Saonia flava]
MSTDNILTNLGQRLENIVIKQGADEKREKNRGVLAMVFVVLFFCVIFVTFIIGYATDDFETNDYKDLLTTVSSILSGPLGFIIGFYFKERQDSGNGGSSKVEE